MRTKFCVLRNLDLKCRFRLISSLENLMVVILRWHDATKTQIYIFLQIYLALVFPYKLLLNDIDELFNVNLNY